MSGVRRSRLIGVVVGLIAVVLPAGVVAATGGGAGQAADGKAGATRFGVEHLTEIAPASVPVAPAPPSSTSPPPAPAPATTTTTRPTATTSRPPSTPTRPTSTTSTTMRPSNLNGPLTPATAWSADNDGVTARMRIEPAAPVAGQPVTFYIDEIKAGDTSCFVLLTFGDMTHIELGPKPTCASPTTPTGLVATHTYAAPGT